jgi:hypothetical protein
VEALPSLIDGLTYLPALAVRPIIEHLQLFANPLK